ncbi:MAG TPA: septal ring lytic transglycosylase RlpA family protein [Verrucomicrobiae bacterium]|nr:septal ring lytic transglycosylase RlpA family protein [Verrucomicrobiae bacterium]
MPDLPQHVTRAFTRLLLSCSLALLILSGAGCASTQTQTQTTSTSNSTSPSASVLPTVQIKSPQTEVGVASYYSRRYHGKRTASGEIYNMYQMTAAHRQLPFGSTVRVTNLRNNRSVIVRINDRGPYIRGRIIDLSLAAARQLDMVKAGLVRVQVDTAIPKPERPIAAAARIDSAP